MNRFGTAVILAGGKSSRMGFDKQLLRLNEQRLIKNLIRKLDNEFNEIIVVTNKFEYYLGFNNKIVRDKIVGRGPLSGIHVGLIEAKSQYVYFTACDMPNINIKYIKHMKEKIGKLNVKACVTKCRDSIEPFNAFYSKDMIKDIEEQLLRDRRSVSFLLERLNVYYVKEEEARQFSPNWDMFLNLNTKEDLKNFIDYSR